EDARDDQRQVVRHRAGDRAAEDVGEHGGEQQRLEHHVEQLLRIAAHLHHRTPGHGQRLAHGLTRPGPGLEVDIEGDGGHARVSFVPDVAASGLSVASSWGSWWPVSSSLWWPVMARKTSSSVGWRTEAVVMDSSASRSAMRMPARAGEHTSEVQSRGRIEWRLLHEQKNGDTN